MEITANRKPGRPRTSYTREALRARDYYFRKKLRKLEDRERLAVNRLEIQNTVLEYLSESILFADRCGWLVAREWLEESFCGRPDASTYQALGMWILDQGRIAEQARLSRALEAAQLLRETGIDPSDTEEVIREKIRRL